MRSLAELGGLKAENLRVLKFNRCPALDLDSLCANGCPPELFVRLMDIKRPGIGRLAARGLTGLHLIDSDVSDDDLEPLVGVPDLQMNWKKHYPITQDEFDARRAAVGLTSSRWQVG